jgi:hypothetical protein
MKWIHLNSTESIIYKNYNQIKAATQQFKLQK